MPLFGECLGHTDELLQESAALAVFYHHDYLI